MASYRKVQDEDGQWWDVWASIPSIIDRRDGRERRQVLRYQERRQHEEVRVPVPNEFRHGWLCFQSGNRWHRVAPIPERWEALSDRELLELLRTAVRAAC